MPKEARTILSEQYKQYDNGWCIATEAGIPMDFVNALRMSENMEAMIPEYDTQSDTIAFALNDPDEGSTFKDLPF